MINAPITPREGNEFVLMMKENYPHRRKLRAPAVSIDMSGRITRAPELSLPVPEAPLPACVLPRTRLVRRFIITCSLLSAFGLMVAFVRYYYPDGGWSALLSLLGFYPFMGAVFGPLCVPARTSRGSFLQLIGLLLPLLFTLWACGMCWGVPSYEYRLGYAMFLGWVSMLGVVYFYLPLWLLHLLLSYIERKIGKNKKSKE